MINDVNYLINYKVIDFADNYLLLYYLADITSNIIYLPW